MLRTVRQRSLARLRQEVEPVEATALGRFLVGWHSLARPRYGLDGLLDVVEQLQGVPVAASVLDSEILPARVRDYSPAMLDTLLGAGEVTWVGVEPLGDRDGRIALYLTDHLSKLLPPKDALTAGPGASRTDQGLAGRETPDRRLPPSQRRVVFRSAARSGGRRLPAGDRRCHLGPGVEGAADQRHPARVARLLISAGEERGELARARRFDRAA